MRRMAWLVLSVVVLVLAGCVGPGATGQGPGATPSDVVDITDQPGSVDGFVGALEDVTVDRCEPDGAGWGASGTVTNPVDRVQSYRIYAAFLDQGDTVGLVQTDVKAVEPGATADWGVRADLNGKNLRCVLRVERFAPQG